MQVCVIAWAALQTEDEEQSSSITLLPILAIVHSSIHVTLSTLVLLGSRLSLTAVCPASACANLDG